MTFLLPANVAPGSPVTYEWLNDYQASLAELDPADGYQAAGTNISDATTNTALVTVPAVNVNANAVAGSIFYLRSYGIVSAPSSAGATLAFNGYSNGSGGTAIATMTAFTPTASLSSALYDAEMWVNFYSTTTVQCLVRLAISSSTTTAAAAVYLAGNNSATPTTITAGNTLTLNAVMGSAVSGSIYRSVAGYWDQVN